MNSGKKNETALNPYDTLSLEQIEDMADGYEDYLLGFDPYTTVIRKDFYEKIRYLIAAKDKHEIEIQKLHPTNVHVGSHPTQGRWEMLKWFAKE